MAVVAEGWVWPEQGERFPQQGYIGILYAPILSLDAVQLPFLA